MIATQQTRLSVTYVDAGDNNTVKYIREMADTDVETFAFDAEQAITEASTAEITNLNTGVKEPDLLTNIAVETPFMNVTVAGLTRGVTYELANIFANSVGRVWTRTLILKCVS